MKHRKPNRAQRAVANTSLPLATAAAVATLFASPAGAAPADQPGAPGATQPETGEPPTDALQDELDMPVDPAPSQPGITTPKPGEPDSEDRLAGPHQPGITNPRIAPLPVPGQDNPVQPVVVPDADDDDATDSDRADRDDLESQGQDRDDRDREPRGDLDEPESSVETDDSDDDQPDRDTLVEPKQWQAPRNQDAPPAPVVEMQGPHGELGASIDGGALLPGNVANTHHFTNDSGYVGTVGYRTVAGHGDAGLAVEHLDPDHIKVNTFTGGAGLPDSTTETMIDLTQVNAAKAAVEQWVAAQPGGDAALAAVQPPQLPEIVQPGQTAPVTINVAGVTTQWGGSLQY